MEFKILILKAPNMTDPDSEKQSPPSHPAFPTSRLPLALIALIGLSLSPAGRADFALNFSGATSTTVIQGIQPLGGQTPFTAVNANQAGELVVDPDTGLNYWHYIMGDPASGFAQEVYIQAGGSAFNTVNHLCGQETICSASGGVVTNGFDNRFNILGNNSGITGNGTGNPNRVILRQVLGGTWDATTSTWTCDTDFCSEFVKSAYADKPKITQGINESDFSSTFILDMSGVAMSNNSTDLTLVSKGSASTGASLTNAQTVKDPSTGEVISSFDMANDSQSTFVTGGKYTYVDGTGSVLGANGHYVYVDGGYNLGSVDYTPFLDESDPSNIWTNFPTLP
jgi:hypothetical protein